MTYVRLCLSIYAQKLQLNGQHVDSIYHTDLTHMYKVSDDVL